MANEQDFEPTGMRQAQITPFFTRLLPAWAVPEWQNANVWRRIVRSQPIAIACRDTLISYLLGTPWEVRAKDPNDKQKYSKEIDEYTELLSYLDGNDFATHLDMVCQDMLDTPFGGACELGREGDLPDGKVLWAQHIDSATLFPTSDYDFPVAQYVPQIGVTPSLPVLFPRHAIDRAYFTPRPEIDKAGWGMAPPEKIFLAIELLFRGDKYYANLLLDTPEAGVLDLLDMSKDSAFEWLESFKELFTGADPFKVPVLYEHTEAAKWIPFGRPPVDLIYDAVTFKYAEIVTAGYGLKVGDIGLAKDAQKSLAGVIHSERQTRRTGFAVVKAKTTAYFKRMLPPYLTFNWIDQDDEAMISKGRARLANAQAYKTLADGQLMGPTELRGQIAADGLYDVQIDPDDLSDIEDAQKKKIENAQASFGGFGGSRPPQFTRPKVPPSKGGDGEAKMQQQSAAAQVRSAFELVEARATSPRVRRVIKLMTKALYPSVAKQLKATPIDELPGWAEAMASLAFDDARFSELTPATRSAIQGRRSDMQRTLEDDRWWSLSSVLDPKDLAEGMVVEFESGIADAASLLTRAAYENGITSDLVEVHVNLADEAMRGSILALAGVWLADTDKKTKDLITRVAMSTIFYSLATPTVAKAIQDGMKLESLLGDDGYINLAARNLLEGLQELLKIRRDDTVKTLSGTQWRDGVKAFFGKMSLSEEVYKLDDDGTLEVDQPKLLASIGTTLPEIWTGG